MKWSKRLKSLTEKEFGPHALPISGRFPKLDWLSRKHLASLGIGSSEARWSSSPKNISEVTGYSDWDCNGVFPLVTLALSGPEEALIVVW